MKSNPHAATPQSAAALAALEIGATGLIVVRLKEQPPEGTAIMTTANGAYFWPMDYKDDRLGSKCWESPFKPGDVVAVKEKWQLYAKASDIVHVIYEASLNKSYTEKVEVFPAHHAKGMNSRPWQERWEPARTLPAWAVRTHLRVKSVACKLLQEVTEEEAELMGFKASHVGDGSSATDQFAYALHAVWSANEHHWFITAEKCKP